MELPPFGWLLVGFMPGTSAAAGISALATRLVQLGPFTVAAPSTPAGLVNFGELQDLPLLLGLALGGLALRALGFTSGQVRVTVS